MNVDRLHELFSYDPTTGELRRKNTGRICGTRHSKTRPYLRVKTPEGQMYAHRIAFALVYGWLPDVIDHADGDAQNNKLDNLRAATQVENGYNRAKDLPVATSRFKGVHFEKQTQKWRAQIKVKGRKLSLGRFESELDAVRAYDAAAERHHGEFAKVNGV